MTASTRKWRTLFHIIYVSQHESDGVWARIPAWGDNVAVKIPWDKIAPELHSKMKVDLRCHGQACIGASAFSELDPFINEAE